MTEAGEGRRQAAADDRQRFKDLFQKLDVNKDGKIEVHELATALQSQRGLPPATSAGSAKTASGKQAQEIISKADSDSNQELSFAEFMEYMQEHERMLKLAFSDLDRNKDGLIEPAEVQAALSKLGLSIDKAEAERLTKKIDKDGSLSVDWREWRNFFQLYPGGDLEDMVQYWRQSLMIDIGDQLTCPPEFTQKERRTGMWWRHLVAGGLAGIVSRTFTAPLDRLKVMLQVHGSTSNLGIVSGLKHMLKEGGVKSLWRGNMANCLKIAPESAMKFAAYEQIKNLLKGDRSSAETTIIERFAAGSTAGAVAQTTIYPLEVIKTRLAVMKTGQYKGILDCGMKIYQGEGMRALYKGYLPNLLGIIPYAGIDLTIYETLKQHYIKTNPDAPEPGVFVLLGCGTVSSTCGQLASYPLALIRTKLQAGATAEAMAGVRPLVTQIIKNEGLRGLYRGILPNFLKVLPAVSISYVIYERAKTMMGIKK